MLDLQIDEHIAQAVSPVLQKLEEVTAEMRKLREEMADQRPDYLRISRAAQLADLSYDHIRRAVESGELPATDKGNGKKHLYRIARPDFDRWMQKGKGGKQLPPRSELKDKMNRYLPGVT